MDDYGPGSDYYPGPVVGDVNMGLMLWSRCGPVAAGWRIVSLIELAVKYARPQLQLPPGRVRPPSWLGHRDLCPTQWAQPCDCDLPPRTTPCTCRYVRWPRDWPYEDEIGATGFTINPRCHHHGDRARTVRLTGTSIQVTREYFEASKPDLLSQMAAGITPQPDHNDTHNPYDLDEDERHA